MKRFLLALALLAIPLVAQTEKKTDSGPPAPQTGPERQKKLFILKYADPRAIQGLLGIFDAAVTSNSDMHALAVTANSTNMAAIEDAIAKLDTPQAASKNVDLTIHLMVGSEADAAIGNALPKDLEPVAAQLKNNFPFKTYRLFDTLTLRSRSDRAANTTSTGGSVKVGESTFTATTTFGVRSASIAPDGSTVRIDGMKAHTRMPVISGTGTVMNFQDLGMETDVDIKEGQKVVVGRFGITRDQAMFLVLTARVVN